MPFFVIVVEAGLRSLDRRYEEAAATLGARRFTTFRRVVLPLDRPVADRRRRAHVGARARRVRRDDPLRRQPPGRDADHAAGDLHRARRPTSAARSRSASSCWRSRSSCSSRCATAGSRHEPRGDGRGSTSGSSRSTSGSRFGPTRRSCCSGPTAPARRRVMRVIAGLLAARLGPDRCSTAMCSTTPTTGEWVRPSAARSGTCSRTTRCSRTSPRSTTSRSGSAARGVRRGGRHRACAGMARARRRGQHAAARPARVERGSGAASRSRPRTRAGAARPAARRTARRARRHRPGRHPSAAPTSPRRASGGRVVVTHDPVDAMTWATGCGDRGRTGGAGGGARGTAPATAAPATSPISSASTSTEATPSGAGSGCADGGELVAAGRNRGDVFAVVHPLAIALHRQEPEGTPRNVFPERWSTLTSRATACG